MSGFGHLRKYQQECLRAVYDRYQAGVRRQLVSLPTGTGKTVIFASFPAFFRLKKRMLVLAHREELLDQARRQILLANPALRVDVEQADRQAAPESQVVVASVPTLGRKSSTRLQRLDPEQFFLVVVDEAHHATAESYRRVLDYLGVFQPETPKLLVGFTATPRRGDGQGLNAVFQEIVFSRGLPEMIQDGHLAPLAGYRIETSIDLSGVRTRHGDFVVEGLSQAVNVDERNQLVVKVYRDLLPNRPTLCFCVDVAHAISLAQTFRAAGVPAASVTGEMPAQERAAALEAFHAGRHRVLTNCMVLTEGFDEPSISGILLARPTQSALLYTQMIGRGTRLFPGKKNATVVDIVDLSRTHQLVTLPTLFGLPHAFNLDGKTTSEVQEALRWTERNRPWVRADLATSLEDLRYRCRKIDLLDLELPPELESQAEFAWTAMGPGRYRLALGHQEALLIAPSILGAWDVILRQASSERVLSSQPSEKKALNRAELFVASERPDAIGLVRRRSAWRQQPVTQKQQDFLRKKKIGIPAGLTKGQASHLISLLIAPAK